MDDDRDRAHDLAGLVEVLVRHRGIERDRVAGVQVVALEPDVGGERAADDQGVLAPVVAQRAPLVGGVAAGGVDHLEEIRHRLGLRRQPFPAHAAGQVDDLAVAAALHDRGGWHRGRRRRGSLRARARAVVLAGSRPEQQVVE
jgi:hypothetical protein